MTDSDPSDGGANHLNLTVTKTNSSTGSDAFHYDLFRWLDGHDTEERMTSTERARIVCIENARTALFALQNTYAYGSEDFQRVYRMRIELDQIAHLEKVWRGER